MIGDDNPFNVGNVVEIGSAKFTHRLKADCKHENLIYDPHNHTIECDDCGDYVDPFKAFMTVIYYWKDARDKLNSRAKEVQKMESKSLILKAAKKAEAGWRSRRFVPACPHCNEAIFPEDGFGSRGINKERALEARKFKNKNRIDK